jgi:hypothetical protein
MCDAVVCHRLICKGDFLGHFFFNYYVLLVKELNVIIFQGVAAFAVVYGMY